MVIFWEFINTPRDSAFCRVSLQASLPDHDFSFNLAVQRRGDSTWIVARQNFTPGSQVNDLVIEGTRDQDLILRVRDNDGAEKRLRYVIDEFWVEGGDIGFVQSIADYRERFDEDRD